jgi:hypothetical protein
MQFDGIQDVKLRFAYNTPGHTLESRGFNSPSIWEPTFGLGTARVAGDGGSGSARHSNALVQICAYVFRPGGIVQILKNADVGPINSNFLSGSGIGLPNLGFFRGNNNTADTVNSLLSLYLPDAPGIYNPVWQISYCPAGAVQWPHGFAPLLIPNSLTGVFPPWGNKVYPGMLVAGSNIFIQNGPLLKHWDEGSLMTGAVVFCTVPDQATGYNYTVINGSNTGGIKNIAWTAKATAQPAPVLRPITMPAHPMMNPSNLIDGQVFAWHGGFVFCFGSIVNGPTGQIFEIAITDPACTRYKLLRFSPQDQTTKNMMLHTANSPTWEIVIDKYGILWMWAGSNDVTLSKQIFTSFEPMAWTLPQVTYVPRSPIALPCYSTCNEVSPQI